MATNNARLPNVEPSIAAGIPLNNKKNVQAVKEFIEWNNSTNWRKENVKKQLAYLDATYKRILNPHIYKVSITEKLKDLKLQFISERIK